MSTSQKNRVAAIVPAAGMGRRFGGSVAKAQVQLLGRPVLVHVLERLEQAPSIHSIWVAAREQDFGWISDLRKKYRLSKLQPPVLGGTVRMASVANACRAADADSPWILVHDAARPCIQVSLIEKVIRTARRFGAAACGLPAPMTVKSVNGNAIVEATLERSRLRLIQTPQVARREHFMDAFSKVKARDLGRFSDDMALLESQKIPVKIVDGDPWNLKITTPEDAELAAWVLKRRKHENAV